MLNIPVRIKAHLSAAAFAPGTGRIYKNFTTAWTFSMRFKRIPPGFANITYPKAIFIWFPTAFRASYVFFSHDKVSIP